MENDASEDKVSLHDIIHSKDSKYNAKDIFQFDSNFFKRDKRTVKYKYVAVKRLATLFSQEMCTLFIFSDITNQFMVLNQRNKEFKEGFFDKVQQTLNQ